MSYRLYIQTHSQLAADLPPLSKNISRLPAALSFIICSFSLDNYFQYFILALKSDFMPKILLQTSIFSPHPPFVQQPKNKSAADTQITAEQLLREAWARQEAAPAPPKQTITDKDELDDYQLRKRKEYEDGIRRNKFQVTTWMRYARWEENQGEFVRYAIVASLFLSPCNSALPIRICFTIVCG
jgi:hypothetical protein